MRATHYTRGSAPTRWVHAWLPDDGEVKAVLHIAHGMSEHGARYAHVAEAFTARGWAVYANDHLGHGKTADEGDLGFFAAENGWQTVIDDLSACIEHERKEHPGVPLALLGHSMGSMITQALLIDRSNTVDAAVLSGTSGKPPAIAQVGRLIARVERKRLGAKKPSKLIDNMAFGKFNKAFKPARTDFDWLSRDPEQVDRYVADPLCGFICSTQLWIDLLDALPVFTNPKQQAKLRKDLPVYVFSGDRDPVGENGVSVRSLVDAYGKAGLADVTLRLYEQGRHEMFNETNRDEVIEHLVGWLERTLLS